MYNCRITARCRTGTYAFDSFWVASSGKGVFFSLNAAKSYNDGCAMLRSSSAPELAHMLNSGPSSPDPSPGDASSPGTFDIARALGSFGDWPAKYARGPDCFRSRPKMMTKAKSEATAFSNWVPRLGDDVAHVGMTKDGARGQVRGSCPHFKKS